MNSSQGGGSKDTWVLDEGPVDLPEPVPARPGPQHLSRSSGQAQSQSQFHGPTPAQEA